MSGAVNVAVKTAWPEDLPTQTRNIMNRVKLIGKNRPRRPDMQGIVAQEESKGHGDSVTVPLDDYGVGVNSMVPGVPEDGVPGALAERTAASAAVLGIPAMIHAW